MFLAEILSLDFLGRDSSRSSGFVGFRHRLILCYRLWSIRVDKETAVWLFKSRLQSIYSTRELGITNNYL